MRSAAYQLRRYWYGLPTALIPAQLSTLCSLMPRTPVIWPPVKSDLSPAPGPCLHLLLLSMVHRLIPVHHLANNHRQSNADHPFSVSAVVRHPEVHPNQHDSRPDTAITAPDCRLRRPAAVRSSAHHIVAGAITSSHTQLTARRHHLVVKSAVMPGPLTIRCSLTEATSSMDFTSMARDTD